METPSTKPFHSSKRRKTRERGIGHEEGVVQCGSVGRTRSVLGAVLGQGKVKQGFSFFCGLSFVRLRGPGLSSRQGAHGGIPHGSQLEESQNTGALKSVPVIQTLPT
ncbi:Uncharacterized protein DAT39_009125 [Clarias magur]|uniref:Uncharacterized protein n=1 Tax=Clarias magur TaxID=1594786 RepID=A0A8J4TZ04_CLAMG|nr:Uncharacterized protein DAT39_009125 [Clarias magur]